MTLRIKQGANIEYGTVEADDVDFSPDATRVRVSVMVPGDVLKKIRARGDVEAIIVEILRKAVA